VKKPSDYFILFFLIILFCTLIVITIFSSRKGDIRTTSSLYKQFGIRIPEGFLIHGIDVSKYQQNIDWKRVTDMEDGGRKISFVFMKATEGVSRIDPYLSKNWRQSRKHKIKRGVYHYFLATQDGKLQAKHFLKNTKFGIGDLRPVVDIEELYGVNYRLMQKRLKDWLETVENQTGQVPIIYTSAKFYQHFLSDKFYKYPIWIAHYTDSERPDIAGDWHFWQHSESGKVNGISGKVDFNVFNGDSAAFSKMLID
jgi:lysozyme